MVPAWVMIIFWAYLELLVITHGHVTVKGRRTLGVLLSIFKGRHFHIHCSDR